MAGFDTDANRYVDSYSLMMHGYASKGFDQSIQIRGRHPDYNKKLLE